MVELDRFIEGTEREVKLDVMDVATLNVNKFGILL